MAQILIRHRVDDFASWKAIFEWDEMENAHAVFESAELRDAMERAGVAETPEIHFMNEAKSGSTQ